VLVATFRASRRSSARRAAAQAASQALAHTTIYGHQEPGGITERAIEKILLLAVEFSRSS
jgi:hypothetical protein